MLAQGLNLIAGIRLRGSATLSFQGLQLPGSLVFWRAVLWMPIRVPVAISQNQYQRLVRRGQHIAEPVFDGRRLQQLLLCRSLGKGLFP